MTGFMDRVRERLNGSGVGVAQEHRIVVSETIDAAARERERADERHQQWQEFEDRLRAKQRRLSWEDMTGQPPGRGESGS